MPRIWHHYDGAAFQAWWKEQTGLQYPSQHYGAIRICYDNSDIEWLAELLEGWRFRAWLSRRRFHIDDHEALQ
jgi:hypothetical protein